MKFNFWIICLFLNFTFIKSTHYLNVSSSEILGPFDKFMGLYLKTNDIKNKHSVFKKLDDKAFIYVSSDNGDNKWIMGSTLSSKALYNSELSINPPENNWFQDRGGPNGYQATSVSVNDVLVPDSLSVTTTDVYGPVATNYPDLLGNYSLDTSAYNGFPVYKAVCKDSYVFVVGGWWIGKNWIPTLHLPDKNPTPVVPLSTRWGYKDFNGAWKEDASLRVNTFNVIIEEKTCTNEVISNEEENQGRLGKDAVCWKEDNYDYWGSDIAQTLSSGEHLCADWCGAVEECNAWTLRKSDNFCSIKTSDFRRTRNNNAISGTKNCAKESFTDWALFEGHNCYEGHGATSILPLPFDRHISLSDCLAACVADSSCEGIIRMSSQKEGNGKCLKRKKIVLQKCDINSNWNLHQKIQGKCSERNETCTQENKNISLIVGISVAITFLIAIICLVILLYKKKKQDKKILFVDDNPLYGEEGEEEYEMNEIVDTNEYYGDISDDE